MKPHKLNRNVSNTAENEPSNLKRLEIKSLSIQSVEFEVRGLVAKGKPEFHQHAPVSSLISTTIVLFTYCTNFNKVQEYGTFTKLEISVKRL